MTFRNKLKKYQKEKIILDFKLKDLFYYFLL